MGHVHWVYHVQQVRVLDCGELHVLPGLVEGLSSIVRREDCWKLCDSASSTHVSRNPRSLPTLYTRARVFKRLLRRVRLKSPYIMPFKQRCLVSRSYCGVKL